METDSLLQDEEKRLEEEIMKLEDEIKKYPPLEELQRELVRQMRDLNIRDFLLQTSLGA